MSLIFVHFEIQLCLHLNHTNPHNLSQTWLLEEGYQNTRRDRMSDLHHHKITIICLLSIDDTDSVLNNNVLTFQQFDWSQNRLHFDTWKRARIFEWLLWPGLWRDILQFKRYVTPGTQSSRVWVGVMVVLFVEEWCWYRWKWYFVVFGDGWS